MSVSINNATQATPVYLVDGASASAVAATTYSLASNATLAAGASTTPVVVRNSKTHAFNYIFAGTSPSLTLQSLGADGTTWVAAVVVTASGAQPIDIYAGSTGAYLRLTNTGSNSISGLYASLVS